MQAKAFARSAGSPINTNALPGAYVPGFTLTSSSRTQKETIELVRRELNSGPVSTILRRNLFHFSGENCPEDV